MDVERWLVVSDVPVYEVSNLGRVRRKENGRILNARSYNKGGYVLVCLSWVNKIYTKSLARLVAKAFIPNPNNFPEVNHKGPKTDCRAIRCAPYTRVHIGYFATKREAKAARDAAIKAMPEVL